MATLSSTLAWKLHGIAKSWTWLSNFTLLISYFITGEGTGNPLQYSCLKNPMDRGAWRAVVRGVAECQTQLKWLSTHARASWTQRTSDSTSELSCCLAAMSCPTLCHPWTAACQASLSFIISWSLLKLVSIELVMPSNHLFLCFSFLLLPSIFPNIGVFSVSGLFTWGSQSIGASVSVLAVNIQGWFPLGLTDLISLLSKGLSRVFSSTTLGKHQFFSRVSISEGPAHPTWSYLER